ncbi:class I SAM-dependent methyltransferase [Skermanella mucosa]|uniref:class I SAM-dependent methyltransferase n=1 Tax=Skermanella mucosa TaxID=1789672 RepID=UPI002B1ED1CD|nr:class I SAM-dependent methyltransferase [Skermanella mucosa]
MAQHTDMPTRGTSPRRLKAMDLIPDLIPLAGARIVDVGCGEGALVRALARRGAQVVGVEILDEALSKARKAEPVGGERYLKGVGEDLPLPDNSADAVIFMNSLHHVPAAHMGKALREAARVLKPGGLALVNEPEPTGGYFELTRLLDDETEVRALAHAAVKAVDALEQVDELFYLNPVKHEDYQSFADRMAGIDPTRSRLIRTRDAELRDLFETIGERREGAWWFDQPARINLLRKPTQ